MQTLYDCCLAATQALLQNGLGKDLQQQWSSWIVVSVVQSQVMKRKLSCTTIADAETQQRHHNNCETNNVGWRMSQHQLAVDCKGLPINALSPSEANCSTPSSSLVRQNACDSGTSPTKDIMVPPLASSSSADSPSCSLIDAETEAVAIITDSGFTKKGRNSNSSLSADLNHPSLAGFLASSLPSNDSYPTNSSSDCVSFEFSSILLRRFPRKNKSITPRSCSPYRI